VGLDYSPDGKRLFAAEARMYPSGEIDQTTLVKRDAETGEILGRLPVAGGIRSIDVSPDGRWVAIGIGHLVGGLSVLSSSCKGEVILADARTLRIEWHHPAPGPWWANAVAFSPNSSRILVGYGTTDSPMGRKSGSAEVLAQSSGAVLKTIPGLGPDENGFCDVAFHPDGRTIALGSYEQIALCDLEGEGPIDVVSASQRSFLYAVAFSPDRRYLASAGWGRSIHLWDAKTMKLVRRLNGHQGFVRDLAFSPDGRSLASTSEDRSVCLWDVETGDPVTVFHGHASNALSVAWHPGGHLLASGGEDDAVKLWDVRASRPIVKWHFGWTCGLAFDPTSGHGVIATQGHGESFNDQFRLWNASTGEPIAEPGPWDPASVPSISEAVRARGLEMPVGSSITAAVAWSKDGKHIATLDRQRTIKVRERATGAVVRSLEDPQGITYVLAFTPDGNHLISGGQFTDSEGSKGKVVCWDLETAAGWIQIALSPDGRRVAVAGFREGPLVLLDVTDGKTVATPALDMGLHFTCCAFDVDGTRLAVGCIDPRYGSNLIKVLDVSTGRVLLRLTGHTGTVTDVAFSPDGRRLASSSEDRTVKLWDTARGEEVFTLRGHTEAVYRVAFSPDGNLLASGSNDFTVRVWDARPLPRPSRP
jgi:WD40 repeat protein